MNTFMNLIKKSLEVRRTIDGVETSKNIRALIGASLLLALDPPTRRLAPASSSSLSAGLIEVLTQGLQRVIQDPGAIVKI